MIHPPAYIGAPWREGLPPGVYEERVPTTAPREVLMDVAAFVGLAERGPVATPVVVETWDEFRTHFGGAGGGRHLPQAVQLFFANGGRRCIVVRAVNCEAASTASWQLAGLSTRNGDCVRLFARNPGAWGNKLRTRLRFRLWPLGTRTLVLPENEADEWVEARRALPVGTLVRLIAAEESNEALQENTPKEEYWFIEAVRPLDNAKTALRFDRPIEGSFRQERVLNAASEVRVELDVTLNQVPTESWVDAALHPAHPRFLIRLLRRRAACERYMQKDAFAAGKPDVSLAIAQGVGPVATPDAAWLEANQTDEAFLDIDSSRGGSSLVRPYYCQWNEPLLPSASLLQGQHSIESGPDAFNQDERGDDGAQGTARRHFFLAPHAESCGVPGRVLDECLYGFGDQPAPLPSIDAYDERNLTQPVSLVHLPDLAHPPQLAPLTEVDTPEPDLDEMRFTDCESPSPVEGSEQYFVYPNLAVSHDRDEIRSRQKAVVEWCEKRRDRIAVLDLPSALMSHEILKWRREVASQRAVLYAPYLRCAPVEDPRGSLMTLSPGGAVCGLIARKERVAGVHAAPANERIEGIAGLYGDTQLPDPAFLHDTRVNAIRSSARGFELLGARTTGTDLEWTHLSVRRLIDYLERQLIIDNQWAVFEPNDRLLWNRLRQRSERRLRTLYDDGAFKGRSEQEAFFVRADGELNTSALRDSGQVRVLIGVAPASPAEFIVFRLVHQADGSASVEEFGG